MRYEVGEKVIIYSKSTGRDIHKAMYDVKQRIEIDNIHYPIGWITAIRDAYPAYFVISYTEKGSGMDYYLTADLMKIPSKFFEDDLFEI